MEFHLENLRVNLFAGLSTFQRPPHSLACGPSSHLQSQQLCYQPADAKKQILEFVKHEDEKNRKRKIHDGKNRQDVLCRYLIDILEGDLFQLVGLEWKNQCVMGIPLGEVLSKDRMIQYKLDLMIRQLRFDNRGGKA